MEVQYLQTAITILLGVAGYLFKQQLNDFKEEVKSLKTLRVADQLEIQTVKQQYLHRDDFREFKQELRGMFEALREDLRTIQTSTCPINQQHKGN